ncbi:ABC transporter ATP-binding protein [uncultured Fibrobacter sp.]|uniref:ABC transporter ATP-binding protein n=1 Tax=uncultured Fibrobacter sp. TaxID=261512 RepID=UPI002629A9F5|nr:ATP-binding cassette domain-containing protein [uncultured Fibrobacter sp.]
MEDITLKVDHLKAGYKGKTVLHDISFDVRRGEIRMILGSSGCGKSTLMNNILKLYKAESGTITYFGKTFPAKSGLDYTTRMRTGVLFQNGALLSDLTVAENAMLPLIRSMPYMPKSQMEAIVADRLEKVHLLHAFHKYPSELSGGMQRRAALARAIALKPELLFCDEPSTGLDPLTARSLDELLLELRDTLGISMVIVSHELESIKIICDRFIYLENGYVYMDGTLKQGLESEDPILKTFFNRECPKEPDNNEYYHFDFID